LGAPVNVDRRGKFEIAGGLLAIVLGAAATGAAAPAPLPEPTPRIVTLPEPTPQIITIEATPRLIASTECFYLAQDLYGLAIDLTDILADIESAYYDYPNENLADFGRRTETILLEMNLPDVPDADACLASQ